MTQHHATVSNAPPRFSKYKSWSVYRLVHFRTSDLLASNHYSNYPEVSSAAISTPASQLRNESQRPVLQLMSHDFLVALERNWAIHQVPTLSLARKLIPINYKAFKNVGCSSAAKQHPKNTPTKPCRALSHHCILTQHLLFAAESILLFPLSESVNEWEKQKQ